MRDLGSSFEEGRGAGVTAADFAKLQRNRQIQAFADMGVLGAVSHHTDRRVQCEWCRSKVFFFGTTPDGARHYCRGCAKRIRQTTQETTTK